MRGLREVVLVTSNMIEITFPHEAWQGSSTSRLFLIPLHQVADCAWRWTRCIRCRNLDTLAWLHYSETQLPRRGRGRSLVFEPLVPNPAHQERRPARGPANSSLRFPKESGGLQ